MRTQPRKGAAIFTDTRDSSPPGKILEVTAYPPPRSGWAVRVEYVKKQLERAGHACVVINIGASRAIPSTEYETVLGAGDFIRKVCERGHWWLLSSDIAARRQQSDTSFPAGRGRFDAALTILRAITSRILKR